MRLPTVVAFVGPNASGKSTVLRAITSCIWFALSSSDLDADEVIPAFQCHLAEDWLHAPIRISIDFDALWVADLAADNAALGSMDRQRAALFRYELDLQPDRHSGQASTVLREALSYRPKGRFRRIFEFVKGQKPYLGSEMKMSPGDARLQAVKHNGSFISTLAKLNHPLMQIVNQDLRQIYSNAWKSSRVPFDIDGITKYYRDNPTVIEELRRELRRIDVGIRNVQLQESPGIQPYFVFEHASLAQPLTLDQQSAGTRHFLVVFPTIYYILQTGRIGVFDDFDADFHPDLAAELLDWFRSDARNRHDAQIFLTLHNVAVLEGLEKEEVFLVQKSAAGATTLYGAQDIIRLRRDVSLERKYRSGVLGALPKIG